MRFEGFTCDTCQKKFESDPLVSVKGYRGAHEGGILLPERFREVTFCCRGCFEKWMFKIIRDLGLLPGADGDNEFGAGIDLEQFKKLVTGRVEDGGE